MAKLYQRQNPLLQRGQIVQPDRQPNIGAAIVKFGADQLDRVAKENFALGHNNLVNDIITTAYEANPTDIKRFNEMVQSGIEKSTKNLPGDMSRKIRESAEKKAFALQNKIKNNQIDAANAQQKAAVMDAIDTLTGDGPLSMNSSFTMIMDGLVNRDSDMIKAGKEAWTAQKAQLSALAELKDGRGNYVIGNATERNMYKQAQFGKDDIFRAAIERLPQDGLNKFDEEIFQNKDAFMKATGIDNKTYDSYEKLIKSRRKAFNADDKRTIKSQDYFEMSKIAAIDPAILDDIEKRNGAPKETTDLLKKAIKEAKRTGNPDAAFDFGDQNEGFLAGLVELQNAISVDDGSPEYNDKLVQAAAKVSINISKMHQNGLGDEQAEILQRALSGVVSDQNFAQALDVSDSSLLSEIARGANNDYHNNIQRREAAIREKYPQADTIPFQRQQMEQELKDLRTNTWANPYFRTRRTEFTEQTGKVLKEMAARYSAQIIALEQMGQHEQAMALKQAANKELIFTKYSDWISRQEFDRLESALKDGRKAYTQIGGSVFQYKGLSQNGIILEGEF